MFNRQGQIKFRTLVAICFCIMMCITTVQLFLGPQFCGEEDCSAVARATHVVDIVIGALLLYLMLPTKIRGRLEALAQDRKRKGYTIGGFLFIVSGIGTYVFANTAWEEIQAGYYDEAEWHFLYVIICVIGLVLGADKLYSTYSKFYSN